MANYDNVELFTRKEGSYSIVKVNLNLFEVSLLRWVNYLHRWEWKLQGTFSSFYQAYYSFNK